MIESQQTRINLDPSFHRAYTSLNREQQKAVDHIEGPVMVVAGPGTGKTQILALRIGNILQRTDTQPQNILCLTYTDAGAIAMRKRLMQFIGADAYKVQVHTFHSFCNQIIQDNQEIFSEHSRLLHISDLEKAQMYRELIDELPVDNPLRKLRGAHYFEAKRLDKLFATIKKEFWDTEMIVGKINEEIKNIQEDKSDKKYYYQINYRSFKPGDPKKKYYDAIRNMDILRAAVNLFEPFQTKMKVAGRYDFDDMIHWVVSAFRSDEMLLASYQERFLYLLVDEYQDTNGSQNEIIRLLADFWESPNLFVVGDEDQAIFRFQGASIANLKQLYDRFRPELIVLSENYRSTQPVLDAATALIANNGERLSDQVPGIEKRLIAQLSDKKALIPKVYEYLNVAQEETAVFEALKALNRAGEQLHDIAVIYRKHAQATNLIKALAYENIAIDVKHRVNILEDPLIINIENILTFLESEFENPGKNDRLLFKIMHFRFFNIVPVDLARISQFCWREYKNPISLRQTIKDQQLLETLNLTNAQAILSFSGLIDLWVQRIPHVTLQILFERILQEGNILADILSGDMRTYRTQVIATFFNYIKNESLRNPEIDLPVFLDTLVQMREIGIPLQMHSLTRTKEGINFLTAHGAKGLEFKHVFIIGCNRRNWEQLRGGNFGFSLPSNLEDPSMDADERDERRLFYVAMTRAKEHLTMSFAAENLTGMPDEPSQFIGEMMSTNKVAFVAKQTLPEEVVTFYEALLDKKDQELPLLDHDLIDKKLERLIISPTALNQFLACARSFYFESILGVPLANNQYLGFGNAVHEALRIFLNRIKQGLDAAPESILDHFSEAMSKYRSFFTTKQYENYLAHGTIILPKYVNEKLGDWKSAQFLSTEEGISHINHRDVPVTGRLDLILKDQTGQNLVIDFKTSNVNNIKLHKDKLQPARNFDEKGGDYWRQVVFYKILLQESGKAEMRMDQGIMSFIEPDKYGEFEDVSFHVSSGEMELVSNQIVDAYAKMRNHEFDKDCGRPHCTWCNFIKNDYVLPPEIIEDENDDVAFDFGGEDLQLHFDF
ncbi:MAG: ATP-dependent helicase [Saprospiraceae bacterium]|nr:ATP-dependent helicase [Saprospiraceae bacterium]